MSELDLRDLAVHSIEVVQSADYGHGIGELAASCTLSSYSVNIQVGR